MTHYYIHGAGLLYEIDESAASTNTLTYHFDHRGSTVALTDATGRVTDREDGGAAAAGATAGADWLGQPFQSSSNGK